MEGRYVLHRIVKMASTKRLSEVVSYVGRRGILHPIAMVAKTTKLREVVSYVGRRVTLLGFVRLWTSHLRKQLLLWVRRLGMLRSLR